MTIMLSAATSLPRDVERATLVGRVWVPDLEGPAVVAVRDGALWDVSETFPTMSQLCEAPDPAGAVRAAGGRRLAALDEVLGNRPGPDRLHLLAPVDLQALKAAGVTFAVSMLERVIEERARGDAAAAEGLRAEIEALIGSDLAALEPGSDRAAALKSSLMEKGLWSQYLEVGIGPDAEIFTKGQPMSAVGTGMACGVHPASRWNNPEPEVALAVASSGAIVGAMLGNDVNLRDIEGRSALLLGKAKDNNASCALGPFLRLFDAGFTLDTVREMEISLTVDGPDGFRLEGRSPMSAISRDPADLVAQMMGAHHQYPDGAVLLAGTMFAPIADRDAPGQGFTHKEGDVVTVATPRLGSLVNIVQPSTQCPPWTFGTGALMRNLARRGLI